MPKLLGSQGSIFSDHCMTMGSVPVNFQFVVLSLLPCRQGSALPLIWKSAPLLWYIPWTCSLVLEDRDLSWSSSGTLVFPLFSFVSQVPQDKLVCQVGGNLLLVTPQTRSFESVRYVVFSPDSSDKKLVVVELTRDVTTWQTAFHVSQHAFGHAHVPGLIYVWNVTTYYALN